MKESFIVYHEIEEQTSTMSDAQVGQLFRAMLRFSKGGEPEFSDPLVGLAFAFVRPIMARDKRKYEEVCEAHREAGRKGGRPRKNPIVHGGDFLPENQKVSSQPDNVYVYVNDHDNDNDNDNDSDKDFFTRSARKEVSDSLDVSQPQPQDAPDCQTEDCQTEDTQTEDCDTCERDAEDVLAYAGKQGYQFTAKQRRRLRRWCALFPFEVVVLAFDRSTYYGGKSVAYVYRILQEWQDRGLHDPEAVENYLAARETQPPGLPAPGRATA